ncbi:MAG: DNA mismatch repair endonuclease MutL [Clostridia bacterium]|nr:DNA mismatch repair endonuclease MutL [Clostridia bacterium]
MGKINVLSFEVANLIAAGEVVDRPASVVKELMENAIDSGADRITVEIQHGGVTFIGVTDNGCGMEAEDLPVAIRRHATSKIREASDLDGISTLGFRGEALAAIASVSHMRIISKPRGADVGAMLEADCGNIISVSERGASEGTRVIVENLFANVPARRKFLKKDATEAMAVAAYVEKIALSRPDIAFRLIIDGTAKLDTVGDGNLKNTIYAVFGRDFASKLIPTDMTLDSVKVSGFIGRSDNVRANRNYQNFFINGRYIKSKTACAAIEQAYTSYIPPEKFPCCVLRIDINPAAVDVNVHPAKLEVKFSNERLVFEAVYYAVRNALEANITRPSIDTSSVWAPPKKVSEMTSPVDEKRESLEKRQVSVPLYTKSEPKPAEKPKTSGGFEHLTAEEYVRQYVAQNAARSTPTQKPQGAVNTPELKVVTPPPVKEEPKVQTVAPKIVETKIYEQVKPAPSGSVENSAPKSLEYRIVGEVFNSYVIVEKGDTMLLIDKHAAHERIIFEKLKKSMKEATITSQMLMIPIEVMMTSAEIRSLEEFKADIEAVGFEVSFGQNTVSVSAIPEGIEMAAVEDMLITMADRMKEGTGSARLTRDIIFEKALYQASCKAAIKAGREYAPEQIKWIVDKLMELPDITFCPHGRPVAMEMKHRQLDKQFERC